MKHATEIGHSRTLIAKAEARLAYQRETVRRLGFDVDPRFASIANETLALMETRLSRLRANHVSLLMEEPRRQAPASAAYTRRQPER